MFIIVFIGERKKGDFQFRFNDACLFIWLYLWVGGRYLFLGVFWFWGYFVFGGILFLFLLQSLLLITYLPYNRIDAYKTSYCFGFGIGSGPHPHGFNSSFPVVFRPSISYTFPN